jgi:hypothetical protein
MAASLTRFPQKETQAPDHERTITLIPGVHYMNVGLAYAGR